MIRNNTACATFIMALTLLGAESARAENAKSVIKRAGEIVTHAKTYQATEQMDMTYGTLGTMSLNMDIKMLPAKKSCIKTSPNANVKPTGQMAMAGAAMNQQIVDDGRFMYVYMPFLNKYLKQKHGTGMSGMMGMGMTPADFASDKGTYKMLAPTTIDGRPVYAIDYKAAGPASANLSGITLYIDKASYRIKRVLINMLAGAQKMSIVMTMKREVLNAPIPDSVFVFSPPPGATEMQGGMGGMMSGGMMPGR